MKHEDAYKLWNEKMDRGDEDLDGIRWRFFGDGCQYDWEEGPFESPNVIDAIPILDHGYIALLDHMGTDIDVINAARISFNRESNSLDERDRKLLKYLWDNRHTSPFEMVEFKFLIKCPLFVVRQWHRHRTWSYNEVSRRYTSEDIQFYIPSAERIRTQNEVNRQGSDESDQFDFMDMLAFQACADIGYDTYQKLLDKGVAREQARMVLPQSMYTTFIGKVDLRNLLHFLSLRFDGHAQWEIRQYAEAILEMIENIVPETVAIFKEGLNDA